MKPNSSFSQFYHRIQPFAICLMAACFYFYEFAQRVLPSAMQPDLMGAFHIGAQGLGILASLFYYGYMPMQIPSGILYDRYGPRILLTFAVFLCAFASLLFSMTHEYYLAGIARFLIGFASSFAYVGAVVLVGRWLPGKYFAFTVGLIQLMGSVGAIVGEAPFVVLVSKIGWRASIVDIAILGFVLTLLFWVIIRDHPNSKAEKLPAEAKTNPHLLKLVTGNPQTWWTGLYVFCIWAPIPIFAELWGIPFLKELLHVSTGKAATALALVWVGTALGGPILGAWSSYLSLRKPPLIVASILSLISSLVILYLPHPSLNLIYVALFFYGFSASAQAVSFGVVYDNIHPSAQGTAIGFNNMACITSGLILLPLVGFILNLFWAGVMSHGAPVYMISSYRVGLATIPLCAVAGLLTVIWGLKETHCKPQY